MSLVVVGLLAPLHLTNSFSDWADFLRYLVRCHFLNLLGHPELTHFHLVHLLARPLHQAAIPLQVVIDPLLFVLVNHQVVAAVLLFVLTAPLMALTPLLPQLL